MRAGPLISHLGLLIQIPGLLALATLPVCALAGETFAFLAFGVAAAVSLPLGVGLSRGAPRGAELGARDAMIVAALAWLVTPLVAALPLLVLGRSAAAVGVYPEVAVFADPLNAAFEGFSGLTSTGLTMSQSPEALPRSVQWWRSLMQWVGGLGVVVLMLAVVGPAGRAHTLYRAEAREEKILPTVRSTVRAYIGIYVGWTLVGVLALRLAGAPWWQAVNHGLTAIATGGFTITERGYTYPLAVQGVMIVLMIAGAVSFAAHGRALRTRRPEPLWGDGQHRLLWALLAAGIVLVTLENRLSAGAWALQESVFQAVSALCTAGFQTAEIDRWSEGAKLLLVGGMVVGGAAGSTAGGVKLARAYLLGKGLQWRVRTVERTPHEVLRYEIDGRGVGAMESAQAVETAAVLAVSWGAFLAVGTLALLHVAPDTATLGDVLLEVASAQSNVGLSSGIAGSALPAPGKLVLMGLMWLGRLEILPVLVLLLPALRPGRR